MRMSWKKGFIGLAIINLLLLCVFFILILLPVTDKEEVEFTDNPAGVDLNFETNKKDVTTLMNSYLQKEAMTEPIGYKVLLTEKVMLIGTMPVLGQKINLVMTFEPVVQENGDLLLEQESIAIGQLKLPPSTILKYIRDNYSLPDWISIDPKKQTVYAALTKMELKSDILVKIERFDLHNDIIKLNLTVPVN